MTNKKSVQLVVCIHNDGYPASLERRKIYQALPDPEAQAHQMIRVVDESGEDYLFPLSYFSAISLPKNLVEALSLGV
jgi:hypothetical protein